MCYISMNREDGLAGLEIVHETESTDSHKRNSMNCPRCVNLSLDLYEADVPYEDETGFSETISY